MNSTIFWELINIIIFFAIIIFAYKAIKFIFIKLKKIDQIEKDLKEIKRKIDNEKNN